jgi:hypothetical protein
MMNRENVTLPRMQWENLKPAPGGLVLVQRFVNTRNYLSGGDLLADTEEATAWLTEHGLLEASERIGESERGRLVEFREALRNLLLAIGARRRISRAGGRPPAGGGGPCGGGAAVGPPQGLLERGMPLGLLRRL